MIRNLLRLVWLLLSAWLIVWVLEGLFGVDQRHSILPFQGDGSSRPALFIGVAWGILPMLGIFSPAGPGRRRARPDDRIAVAKVIAVDATGTAINDVPQYDIFVRVSPDSGEDFIGQLRMLVTPDEQSSLVIGAPLPVRFSSMKPDAVALADPLDPAVRQALLDWRIAKGLIDPRQVRARTSGITSPADILSVRPTGKRLEGQSELALTVLISPEGQTPWEAETTLFAYPQAIGRLQVGSPVWAMYRREDPKTVAITIEKETVA